MMLFTKLLNSKLSDNWEEAASITVNSLFSFIDDNKECYSDLMSVMLAGQNLGTNYLENMRIIVDYMIERKVWNYEDSDDEQIANIIMQFWGHLSLLSVLSSKKINNDFNIKEYQRLINRTVVKKQRDYGPENIAKFGLNGLVIRIHDKVARLENLLSKNTNPSNESIEDTLLDIIGYSIIALMWINKTFLLPMSNLDTFVPKALSEDEFFHSIEESPINRHQKIPVTTSNGPINTSYTVYDSRGSQIGYGSYQYPNPKHPNLKFR